MPARTIHKIVLFIATVFPSRKDYPRIQPPIRQYYIRTVMTSVIDPNRPFTEAQSAIPLTAATAALAAAPFVTSR